jgi:hypothetical protein
MSPVKALWGTFSVADHLRERPFVADVLLYDRLVVPVPAGDAELARWQQRKRNPELQAALLKLIGPNIVVRAPWNEQRRKHWAARLGAATPDDTDLTGPVRDTVANAVAQDVAGIAHYRKHPMPGGPESPDDPAQLYTREVLYEEFRSKRDRALLKGIPTVDEIDAVVAYGAYHDFAGDRGEIVTDSDDDASPDAPGEAGRGDGRDVRHGTDTADISRRMPVLLFQWPFLAPSNPERSDTDLLKEALELAHDDKIRQWRTAVQTWRADAIMKGMSDTDLLGAMEDLLEDYAAAAKKRKIQVIRQWACVAGAFASGVAAVPFPPAGGAAAAFGAAAAVPPPKIPTQLEAAALFYEARRRFR